MSKTFTFVTPEDMARTNERIATVAKQVETLQCDMQRLERTKQTAPTGLQPTCVEPTGEEPTYQRRHRPIEACDTRELQKQMFGLFSVCFGTTCREARHQFTRTVIGEDRMRTQNPSWAIDNMQMTRMRRVKVLRALEAICEVEDLVGRRVAR